MMLDPWPQSSTRTSLTNAIRHQGLKPGDLVLVFDGQSGVSDWAIVLDHWFFSDTQSSARSLRPFFGRHGPVWLSSESDVIILSRLRDAVG